MKTRNFRNLQVWQRSMSLACKVYASTGSFPKDERFGLTGQMRRAAVSIPSNIAEGHGPLTERSLSLFLSQARGSLNELATQLELAQRLDFTTADQIFPVQREIGDLARMLNALLTAIRHPASAARTPLTTDSD